MIRSAHNGTATSVNNRVRKYKARMKDHVAKFQQGLVERIISDSRQKGVIVEAVSFSPRLGTSLRLDNIRCATCTYNCIYCDQGGPAVISTVRRECVSPYEVFFVVQNKLNSVKAEGIEIDYISIHPHSEPTIDIALWREIGLLRDLGCKIAVFTNASLMWNPLVQECLQCADYVSLKIDTVKEETWRKINRPHSCLRFDQILNGISEFSAAYAGILTTETMLIKGLNDAAAELEAIGVYFRSLKRSRSYFMTPDCSSCVGRAKPPEADFMKWAVEYCLRNIPSSEIVAATMEAA